MGKVWSYVSAFLGGALIVLVIAMKWIAGDDYTVEVKKIKNKKVWGNVDTTIRQDVDSGDMTSKNENKELRKQEREAKKAARKLKRDLKKK